MGGSSGGGGGGGSQTQSTNSQNQFMKWQDYVPGPTYQAYYNLMPELMGKIGKGLTDPEKQYYTGQAMTGAANQTLGAGKSMSDALARSGARGGAVSEAYGNLARGKVGAGVQGVNYVTGQDIAQKQQNIDNLLRAIAVPGGPTVSGSSGTSTTKTTQSGGS
jgi:hypothetical protein